MRNRVAFVGFFGLCVGLAASGGCDLLQGLKPATVVETGGGPPGSGGQGGAGGTGGPTTGGGGTTTSAGGSGGTSTAPACEPGTTIECYTGEPAATKDVAPCHAGQRACKTDGSGYEDVCEGEVVPQPETCADTSDEDCDTLDCARWAAVFGDESEQTPLDVATDAAGNAYVLGSFKGSIQLEGEPHVSAGGWDLFLVKLNAGGQVQWSRRFGDALDQTSGEIAVDPLGNVIIAGALTGTLDFGGSNIQAKDVFVARLDPAGQHVWSKGFQATSPWSVHVGAAPDGTALLWTDFLGSASFGAGTLSAGVDRKAVLVGLAPADGSNTLQKTFVSTGAPSMPGTAYNHTLAKSVDIDGSGNVTLGGHFDGNKINLGGSDVVGQAGYGGSFLARFDKLGNHAWSAAEAVNDDLSVNPSGGVTLTELDDADGFAPCFSARVRAYSNVGATLWTQTYMCPDQNKDFLFIDSSADAQGNSVLSLVPPDTAFDFGGGSLAAIGVKDIVLLKLGSEGGHLWSRRFGAPGASQGPAVIATAPNGDIVLAAQVSGPVDVGTGPLMTKGQDVLIARFAP